MPKSKSIEKRGLESGLSHQYIQGCLTEMVSGHPHFICLWNTSIQYTIAGPRSAAFVLHAQVQWRLGLSHERFCGSPTSYYVRVSITTRGPQTKHTRAYLRMSDAAIQGFMPY